MLLMRMSGVCVSLAYAFADVSKLEHLEIYRVDCICVRLGFQ